MGLVWQIFRSVWVIVFQHLNLLENRTALEGTFLGYQTSIDHPLIEVEDLGMEVTALSTNRHWVAYTSIIYQ